MNQIVRNIEVVAEVTDSDGALHPVAVYVRPRDLNPQVLTLLMEKANLHLPAAQALADDSVLGG